VSLAARAVAALTRTRLWRELDGHLNLGYVGYRLTTERIEMAHYFDGAGAPQPLLFSLVVPTYGIALSYLQDLLRSVRDQTYARWELCICDDHDPSPGVGAYLDALLAANPQQVRLVRHTENRGIAAATRSALALARGDIFVFVDADDLLHPRALEALAVKFSESEEIDFVYTDHDFMTDWGLRFRPVRKPAFSPELLHAANYINHLTAVRRDCLERAQPIFSDAVSGAQDWDLCFRLTRAARRVGHVPLILYHWRSRPGSIAAGGNAKQWALAAAHRVLTERIEEIDERLAVVGGFLEAAGVDFRHGVPLPELHVLSLGAGPANELEYRGTTRRASLDAHHFAERVANYVETIRDPDALLLFERCGAPPVKGPLSMLGAYASLPNVSAVWPFRNDFARSAYTVQQNALVPVAVPRSSFSSLTGNVLTGPLHGMVTRAQVFRKNGGLSATLEGDALGADYGLRGLERGLRNVAVRNVRCDYEFASLPLPATALPFDPYA
jgi:hypothetical protein